MRRSRRVGRGTWSKTGPAGPARSLRSEPARSAMSPKRTGSHAISDGGRPASGPPTPPPPPAPSTTAVTPPTCRGSYRRRGRPAAGSPASCPAGRRRSGVARPSSSSTGSTCSAVAASVAASSGGSSGSLYSSRNRSTACGASRGQPSWNSALTRFKAKPCTLVWPEDQNTAAIEKRASSAMALGMRANKRRSGSARASQPARVARIRQRGSGCRR